MSTPASFRAREKVRGQCFTKKYLPYCKSLLIFCARTNFGVISVHILVKKNHASLGNFWKKFFQTGLIARIKIDIKMQEGNRAKPISNFWQCVFNKTFYQAHSL